MAEYRILIYEDTLSYAEALKYNLVPKLEIKGIQLTFIIRMDTETIQEDLEHIPNLILVDFDLGEYSGEEVLAYIEGDPDFKSASIYFYSGGEDLDTLQSVADNYSQNIQCFTKDEDVEDSELENSIIQLAISKAQ